MQTKPIHLKMMLDCRGQLKQNKCKANLYLDFGTETSVLQLAVLCLMQSCKNAAIHCHSKTSYFYTVASRVWTNLEQERLYLNLKLLLD